MNKSKMTNYIFQELLRVSKNEFSSGDLLECAALIVEANDNPVFDTRPYFSDGRPPDFKRSIDYELIEHPWEILCQYTEDLKNIGCALFDDYTGHISDDFILQQALLTS